MARTSASLGQSDFKKEQFMNHWWIMHGYGGYIWSAYSLVLGVMAMNAYRAWARSKYVLRHLLQWLNG